MSQPPQPGPPYGEGHGGPPQGRPGGTPPGYGAGAGWVPQQPTGTPAADGVPAYGEAPASGAVPAYGEAPAHGAAYGQPYGQPYGPGQPFGVPFVPAPMSRRLLARLLDAAVILVPALVILGLLFAWGYAAADPNTGQGAVAPTVLGILFGYIVLPLASIAYEVVLVARGATLGKRWMGIRVVRDEDGELPGYGPSALRYLIFFAASFVPLVGTVLVAVSPWFDNSGKRQGWHDLVARTRVVEAR